MTPAATSSSRKPRGYVISSLVVLLMVVVIALLVWRAYLIYQGAAASSANVSGNPQVMGYLIGGLLGSVALCVAITAGIGVGSYFVFGRSQNAANGAMDVVLLLAIVVYGFQIYAWLNSPRYAAIQQAQAGGGGPAANGQNKAGSSNGVDSLADRMKAANDRSKEQLDAATKRSQEQMEAQRKAAEEQSRRMREQMEAARQGRLPAQSPSSVAPAPPTPGTTPGPASPRPTRPPTMADDPKAVEALSAVRKDADDRVSAVSSLADEMLEACRRAPEASYSSIDARLKKLKSLRQSATDLGRWLGGLDKAADKALTDAGVEALGARIRFTSEYRAAMRASACDQVARFCDEAVEEAELLRGKIGKWRLGGDGKVETKERDLEFKCRSLRSLIESTTSRRSSLVDQLNGR